MAATASKVPDGCPLTESQFVTLQYAMDGNSTAEIAELECVSPSAIRSRLFEAYARLGVHDRSGAMAYMGERGWWGGWKLPAVPQDEDPPLSPWLMSYLSAFDRFLESGMRDGRARNLMTVALWGSRHG